MKSTIVDIHCPHCGKANDRHTGRFESEPKPGDVGLCWSCLGCAIFTEDGQRKPTAEEQAQLDVNPHVQDAIRIARASASPTHAMTKFENRS